MTRYYNLQVYIFIIIVLCVLYNFFKLYLVKDIYFIGNYSNINSSCENVRRSIDEFPPDIFSKEQRRHGAVIFHLLVAFYGFLFITFTCHDYFLPSVFCICSGMMYTVQHCRKKKEKNWKHFFFF